MVVARPALLAIVGDLQASPVGVVITSYSIHYTKLYEVRLAVVLRLAVLLHRSRSEQPLPAIGVEASNSYNFV